MTYCFVALKTSISYLLFDSIFTEVLVPGREDVGIKASQAIRKTYTGSCNPSRRRIGLGCLRDVGHQSEAQLHPFCQGATEGVCDRRPARPGETMPW